MLKSILQVPKRSGLKRIVDQNPLSQITETAFAAGVLFTENIPKNELILQSSNYTLQNMFDSSPNGENKMHENLIHKNFSVREILPPSLFWKLSNVHQDYRVLLKEGRPGEYFLLFDIFQIESYIRGYFNTVLYAPTRTLIVYR